MVILDFLLIMALITLLVAGNCFIHWIRSIGKPDHEYDPADL